MDNVVDIQIATELNLSKEGIRTRLENEIHRDEDVMEALFQASQALYRWKIKEGIDLGEEWCLVVHEAMLIIMALDERQELLSAVAGQLTYLFGHLAKEDAIRVANRALVVMSDADMFDLDHVEYDIEDMSGAIEHVEHYYIINPWEIGEATSKLIKRSMYLPPMLCKPMKLTHNRSNPHLTGEGKSLILGKFNHHDGDICLDTLNIANSVAMSMNVDMLRNIKESILIPLELQLKLKSDPKRKQQYDKFMSDTSDVYAYLVKNGNRFYLTHKPDKRGRKYAQGYHATTQGDAFRKSSVDLFNKEIVDGF